MSIFSGSNVPDFQIFWARFSDFPIFWAKFADFPIFWAKFSDCQICTFSGLKFQISRFILEKWKLSPTQLKTGNAEIWKHTPTNPEI